MHPSHKNLDAVFFFTLLRKRRKQTRHKQKNQTTKTRKPMPEQEKKGPSGFETTVKVVIKAFEILGDILTYTGGKKNGGK